MIDLHDQITSLPRGQASAKLYLTGDNNQTEVAGDGPKTTRKNRRFTETIRQFLDWRRPPCPKEVKRGKAMDMGRVGFAGSGVILAGGTQS